MSNDSKSEESMSENMIDVLKGAILLEIKGKTFYVTVAQ